MLQIKDFFGGELIEEKLNIILSLISDVFFEYNIEKDIIKFNGKSHLNGLIQKGFRDYIIMTNKVHEEDKKAILDFLDKKTSGECEYRQKDATGNMSWRLARAHVIKDEQNVPNTIIGCIYQVNKKDNKNELDISELDTLTELYNKEAIEVKINNYLKIEGNKGKHALFIMDIDNFKIVNDNLGRLFGDAVLTNIADQLKKQFFASGYTARVGGDEFVIFLKDIEQIETLQQKVNLISMICEDTYTGESSLNQVSCSIGIARYPFDGQDYNELFKNADKALYEVKNNGKNDSVFYNITTENLYPSDSEYFNYYQVNEDDGYNFSDFNKKITTFAFDIMANTKDVNSAINMLLDQVGKHFGVSHVAILESLEDNDILNMTYIWSEKLGKIEDNGLYDIEHVKFNDYSNLFDDRGVYLIQNCTNNVKDEFLKHDVYNSIGVKSILQCAIYDEGVFKGCISIDDCDEIREWSKSDIDSLCTIAKILSSYLLKIRASEKINERLEKIRNYDELTGLPTFYKFKKDTKDILNQHMNNQYAIVNSDISNFRYINDVLSYKSGDQVLCDYAELLCNSLSKNEVAARISADNFMVLLMCPDEKALIRRVESLNERFSIEQKLKNIHLNIVIISGACIINENTDVMSVIDNSNIARKSVKTSLKTLCKLYDNKMSERISKEIEIANSMENALENREFSIYLQPKINLSDNRLVGAEALVRWIKPDGTIITPDNFIPQFENNGFIVNLDFYVYEETCKTIRKWLDTGINVVPISVNVSRVHLNEECFVEKFTKLVERYHIPTKLLELELTETIFLDHTEVAINTMREFRKLGYSVSIDDFGAGYSSLNLLKDMQTDVLKLDKEFFRQGEMQKEEKVIVTNIINMAKQLNMKVLSEGVETKMQSDFLRDISCDMAQGYFYSRPMPVKEFEKLILNKHFVL